MAGPPATPAGSATVVGPSDLRNRAKQLLSGTRGRFIFMGTMVAIVFIEAVVLSSLAPTLPTNVAPDDARLAFQSVISVDGVMMGFTGILFGALLTRDRTGGRTFSLLTTMVVSISLYLLSVMNAFLAILTVGTAPVTQAALISPLALMIYATSILFFGIAVYIIRE